VSWTDYFSDLPLTAIFHTSAGHDKPLSSFAADAAAGTLPSVAFGDGAVLSDQPINGSNYETDEHPPADVRAGEYVISQVVTVPGNSPSGGDSAFLLPYDEHGAFEDLMRPPRVTQAGLPPPDAISPGQCAD